MRGEARGCVAAPWAWQRRMRRVLYMPIGTSYAVALVAGLYYWIQLCFSEVQLISVEFGVVILDSGKLLVNPLSC